MAWSMGYNQQKRAWAIYPALTMDSDLLTSKDVIWRTRADHAIKVFEGKMKEMKR
jgi:hypothetical protein